MAAINFRLELLASIVFNNNHGSIITHSVCMQQNNILHDNYNVCVKAISSFIV